jgi:hypothetical protein
MSEEEALKERLTAAFEELADRAQPDLRERQQDFVFHMLDWKDDLASLAALYSEPERFSTEEARTIVQTFLYHAASHVVAAARLTGHFLDAFGENSPKSKSPER